MVNKASDHENVVAGTNLIMPHQVSRDESIDINMRYIEQSVATFGIDVVERHIGNSYVVLSGAECPFVRLKREDIDAPAFFVYPDDGSAASRDNMPITDRINVCLVRIIGIDVADEKPCSAEFGTRTGLFYRFVKIERRFQKIGV